MYSWLEYGGFLNSDYKSIWNAKIPLKVRIFLWLAKQNRILTRDNLNKRGWTGPLNCVFCQEYESVDHLFTSCSVANQIWQLISHFNGFEFEGTNMQDLWELDRCIPLSLKDPHLVELTRGAVLWTLWIERNRIIFKGHIRSIRNIGSQIIATAKFWDVGIENGFIEDSRTGTDS